MPTDPPSANQTNVPGPLGRAQPPAHLPQHRSPYQFPHQPQPNYPILPQQPRPQGLPHSQNPQYPQHPQYGLSPQSPLHALQQPTPQRQPQQNQPQQPTASLSPSSQFFTGPGYQQPITAYPGQQFQMNPYLYQGPYPYTIPNSSQIQPQPPVSSHTKLPFGQPPSSTPAQRSSTRPIQVPPPRKKNILQIVDPDTNEEVKVSKVDARPTSKPPVPSPVARPLVKIPPRRSHALELVSDPADDAKLSSETQNSSPQASPQSTNIKSTQEMTSVTALNIAGDKSHSQVESKVSHVSEASTSSTEDTSGPSTAKHFVPGDSIKSPEPVQLTPSPEETPKVPKATTAPLITQVSSPVTDDSDASRPNSTEASGLKHVYVKPGNLKTDVKNDTSDKSGSSDLKPKTQPGRNEDAPTTCPGVPSKNSDTPPFSVDVSAHSTAQIDVSSPVEHKASAETGSTCQDKESPAETLEGQCLPEGNSGKQETREGSSASTEENAEKPLERPPFGTPDTSEKRTSPEPSADSIVSSDSNSGPKVSEPINDAGAAQTPGPAFSTGDRRVYVPDFMWGMKSMPNTKKATEFETILGSRDILKNGSPSNFRRDSKGNRPGKGGAGPILTDPRRAFPGQSGGASHMAPPMRGAAPPGMGGVGLYPFDKFDLLDARSRAPPPAPRNQPSIRDGDPRGSRQSGSRGHMDGLTRKGQGPIDPFVMHTPVEKLKRTDKGWKRNRDADDEVTAKVKSVRSLLNKLTLEKFEKIFKQIVDVGISTFAVLDGVVTEIFEKTLFEPKFSAMYAELCRRLEGALFDALTKANFIDADGKAITFRRILINHCRDEFTRFASSEAKPNAADEGKQTEAQKESKEESTTDESLSAGEKAAKAKQHKEEEEEQAKRRMLANVKFIGELFIKDLLKQNVIHKQCIQKLLRLGIEKREEDVLEALCKLISKTGAKLSESKEANQYIDSYFNHLKALSMDPTLPARIRFMLQDLIEQRANNWKVRREEAGAKTIAEIHEEIEKEERAKQEAQAAARDRRNRGGMHGRDRSQQSFAPRVTMTMASSRRSSSSVSRTNSMIEKFGQRGTSAVSSNNLRDFRLTPGGTRAMAAGSSGSGSLRPRSGMLNPFAPLVESRDSGMNGQSEDVRQGRAPKSAAPKSTLPNRRAPLKHPPPSPEKTKGKARSLVKEFWFVGLTNEVREVLAEEIPKSDYAVFVEELIRISMDAKVDEMEKSLGLIRDLSTGPLSGTDIVSGFSPILSQLSDLEMDNPRVTEFVGRYIGAVASTRKLPEGTTANFGLTFVSRALPETEDPKRVTKLYVSLFSTLQKELASSIPEVKDRIHTLKNIYTSLDVDISGLMNAWNPMRGLSALDDMLKSNSLSFLVPHLKMEENLKAMLQSSASGKEVLELFKTCLEPDEGFLRSVIRQSLDWVLLNPLDDVKDSFSDVIGNSLSNAFDKKFSDDAQMGGLLEAQLFVTRNLEVLPSKRVGSFDKPGAIAFDLLYDAEIVSRDTLLRWKEDTGRSVRVSGKDKMVMQTSQFFQWLAQLQQ